MPAANSRPILQLAVARGLLTAAEAAPLVDLPSDALVQRGLLTPAELDLLRNLAARLESARTEIQRRADSGSISRRAARRASELLDDSARAQPISPDAAVAQAQAEPLPSRLFNRYDVLDELGRGGMGVVYKVCDSLLGRTVALKVLPPGDADNVARFQREARLVARLTHPNIVGLHEFGQDGDVRYFTMPYIDGTTLLHERRTRGADFRFFAERTAEAADALAYAHAQGVLHRDVKPGNILLDSQGALGGARGARAFLADFGLATAPTDFTQLTLSGTILGTPAYMAPEQAKPVHGQALDARADVYALGATLYYALTGRDPFTGSNAFEIIDSVLTREPSSARVVEPTVPRELEIITQKAMAKERERRYATAAELGADLRRWLAGEAISAKPPSWTYRLARKIRRRKAVYGLSAAVTVLLAVAAGLTLWARGERQRRYGQAWEILRPIARQVGEIENLKYARGLGRDEIERFLSPLVDQMDVLIRDRPDFGPALAWRGKALELEGRVEEAEEAYRSACEKAERSAEPWFLRGTFYLARYQDSMPLPPFEIDTAGPRPAPPAPENDEQRQWRQRGLADLEQVELLRPMDPEFLGEQARLARAFAWLHEGRYEDAAREAEGLTHPRARLVRGRSIYYLGRFEEALVDLRLAAAAWPHHPDAWMSRGLAAHFAGKVRALRGEDPRALYEESIACYSEAARMIPSWWNPLLDRAVSSTDLAEWKIRGGEDPTAEIEAALSGLDGLLERWPDLAQGYRARAVARQCLADWTAGLGLDPTPLHVQAIADLDRAIEREAENPALYANRGESWKAIGRWNSRPGSDPSEDYARAARDFDAAVARSPEEASFLYPRATAYSEWGQWKAGAGQDPSREYDSALADFERAASLNPNDAVLLNNFGNLRRQRGEWSAAHEGDPTPELQAALELFDRSLGLDPNSPGAYSNRGTVHLFLGRWLASRDQDPRAELEAAILDTTEALRCNPAYVSAFLNRGNGRLNLGRWRANHGEDPVPDWRAAVEDYNRYLALHPRATNPIQNRGLTLATLAAWLARSPAAAAEAADAYRRAARDFESILEIVPHHPQADAFRRAIESYRAQADRLAPSDDF